MRKKQEVQLKDKTAVPEKEAGDKKYTSSPVFARSLFCVTDEARKAYICNVTTKGGLNFFIYKCFQQVYLANTVVSKKQTCLLQYNTIKLGIRFPEWIFIPNLQTVREITMQTLLSYNSWCC